VHLTYPDEFVSVELCVFLAIFFLVSELQGELYQILILLAHGLLCCMTIHDGRASADLQFDERCKPNTQCFSAMSALAREYVKHCEVIALSSADLV
jgi:hypothetical protein